MAKEINKKQLVRKISDLIAAEFGASIAAPGGGQYNCDGPIFKCGNEYNCSQSVSCNAHYTSGLKADLLKKEDRVLDIGDNLSKQIGRLLEKDISAMIDPVITAAKHCDASSFTCESGTFDCTRSFGCNNKFTG